MNIKSSTRIASTFLSIWLVGPLVMDIAPAAAGGITWTAQRANSQTAFNTRKRVTSPGGGTYTGPGDTTGGTAGSPPSGLRYYGKVCSPLDSELCIYGVWLWSNVVAGLQDGFTYYSACHAFSEETLLMQDYYLGQGWNGYPAVTCTTPALDIYGAALGSHYSVPCSSTNPTDLTNPEVLDLGADVISTTNLMDLCDLEENAGY